MVEMKEWKGLPRTTFCYHKMIEDEGVEWAASNHLLLPKNGRNGGIWKGLPRTVFYFKNICRNKGMEGAASSHLLLP